MLGPFLAALPSVPLHSILLAASPATAPVDDPPPGLLASGLVVGFRYSNGCQNFYHLMRLTPNVPSHERDMTELSTQTVALHKDFGGKVNGLVSLSCIIHLTGAIVLLAAVRANGLPERSGDPAGGTADSSSVSIDTDGSRP